MNHDESPKDLRWISLFDQKMKWVSEPLNRATSQAAEVQ